MINRNNIYVLCTRTLYILKTAPLSINLFCEINLSLSILVSDLKTKYACSFGIEPFCLF